MPRKTQTVKLNNMENIIEDIKRKSKYFDDILKYDGITIEFTCKSNVKREIVESDIKTYCKLNKLNVYTIEDNKEDTRKFILQFPDMVPAYTEDEVQKMYIANFKWLLDDTMRNKPDITKTFILDNTVKYVKLAVTTYYRSNVNQYKEKLDDYLTNTLYRQKLNMLFMTYLDEYWASRGDK